MTDEERAALREKYRNGDPVGRSQNFFHGTSSALGTYNPGDHLDPNAEHTQVHSVSMRSSAYFTTDKNRADFYASKAVDKFGGEPAVYRVTPTGQYTQDIHNKRTPENKMTRSPLRIESQEDWGDWRKTHREV
jgi:hypothetical protein